MSRTRFSQYLAVCMLLLVAVSALGQTTTASIRGKVTDEQGNPFPTAEITATAVGVGYTHRATAGNDGTFLLAGLTPGPYRIEVTAPSYKASSREVLVQVGQTLDANFRLQPDLVVMEQITVVGNTPVEMQTQEIATNVTRRQIENLPQNDRNFLNFAGLAPGVQLGTDEFRKEVKAGAQTSSSTNIFIDGVSFKNDVTQGGTVGQDASRGNPFPQNAVQEFRVITQNYSAEFEKASSAIITAVTKSGTNTMTGEGFFYYQNKGLVAENPLTHANPEYTRNQYGVSLGGPIIRDKMHYFASYEANDQNRENTVALGGGFSTNAALRQSLQKYVGTFSSPFRSDLGFGKVSFQPSSPQLLELTGSYRKETDVRNFGGTTSRETAENVKNGVNTALLRHQFTGSNWLNEASLNYQKSRFNPQPLNPDLVSLEYENLLRIGGRDTTQDIGQRRLALRDDYTTSAFKLGPGDHTLKLGANVARLKYKVTKFFEENPHFFFREDLSSTIPYKARFGFGNPDLSADNTEYGVYGQDDWNFNKKLILNLGLRWDYETNMNDTDYRTPADVIARLSDQFPSNYFSTGQRKADKNLFQPRLGFSYDIAGDAKTVVFGGVGRYYDRNLFNNTLDERFRLQHVVGEFFFSPDGSPVFGQPAAKWDPKYLDPAQLRALQATGITGKPEIFLIDNNTHVPYSNQWNLGVRHAFGSLVASASYANIKSHNGLSFQWGAGFCCPVYDPAYSNVLVSADNVKTWYNAVYVSLDRPYSETANFGFNIAYTHAKAEQIGGDLFSLDLPTIADWPRYGTPGTADNRIVANGITELPFDVRFSTIIQYSSGDKFRINDQTRGFCVGCFRPRTGEGASYTIVDLRAEKGFDFGKTRLGLILEGFNVTNSKRYSFFNDFLGPNGNPNLGKGTAIVGNSQRRLQLGARVSF